MQQMQLWMPGQFYRQIDDLQPVLDCWDAAASKAQEKLQRYLEKLKKDLGPLPATERNLFLHMDIAVRPEHYLHQHDLDNYLYPVVNKLGADHFVFVSGTKHQGGPSRLIVGWAKPGGVLDENQGWVHAPIDPISTSTAKLAWKEQVRASLLACQPARLEAWPVEMHLAWRCSALRNWATLWKPTIDAMGPVLGEPHPQRPFDPDDGRIVSLGLHLTKDDTLGWAVAIGMNWRLAPVKLPTRFV